MEKKINVLIKNDKSLFVETKDYKGEACVSAVKKLFESFLEIEDLNHTSEYYEKEADISIGVETKI